MYNVHPFIDGSARTTWHLRNYLLMLNGLRPLIDLNDQDRHEKAWWNATADDRHCVIAAALGHALGPSVQSRPTRTVPASTFDILTATPDLNHARP